MFGYVSLNRSGFGCPAWLPLPPSSIVASLLLWGLLTLLHLLFPTSSGDRRVPAVAHRETDGPRKPSRFCGKMARWHGVDSLLGRDEEAEYSTTLVSLGPWWEDGHSSKLPDIISSSANYFPTEVRSRGVSTAVMMSRRGSIGRPSSRICWVPVSLGRPCSSSGLLPCWQGRNLPAAGDSRPKSCLHGGHLERGRDGCEPGLNSKSGNANHIRRWVTTNVRDMQGDRQHLFHKLVISDSSRRKHL
ncbi:hypothetical protein GWK47_002918 [Chionoecetes opilio]|uniref:Uncharacterized protein n=1 Tax=Chionoecetes opilio TaxID=41210 RepID=A0A8J5CCY4_CHIOP|nr:hypothetical protein GWK47_002918 [Chionoecetes opilio]